jgi:hypothetical protein
MAARLCSEPAAKDAILYSYRHGFSGFAAVLTDRQAARLAGELTISLTSSSASAAFLCDPDEGPPAFLGSNRIAVSKIGLESCEWCGIVFLTCTPPGAGISCE